MPRPSRVAIGLVRKPKRSMPCPFADLVFQAQTVHRRNFDPNHVETASLLSIKTGGCPEDCGYCSQSAHYDTDVKATRLMDQLSVVETARRARDAGATRFCMAAAWRNPKDRDLDRVCNMVSAVKDLGMETCATLGSADAPSQAAPAARRPASTSTITTSTPRRSSTDKIITTRTLRTVSTRWRMRRDAGLKVCCGGIIGMGEQVEDRLGMLLLLANLPSPPESVPINMWNEVKGVPVNDTAERPDPIALARLVAVARILMPASVVRPIGRASVHDRRTAVRFVSWPAPIRSSSATFC